MSPRQAIAVGLCVLLVALDGFDVLAISFASPGIAKEWGIDRAALGIVLSMEIIGMALGSIVLGNVADRIGRRPTILGCLVVMTAGMFLATTARGVEPMSVFRFITGVGIGGMLAAINAVAAEFANNRRRNLAVTLMAAGYPLGAVFGGMIATTLLAGGDWRSVFMFGAFATAVCIPLVLWLLPESVSYLVERQPANALARVNPTLRRLGSSRGRIVAADVGSDCARERDRSPSSSPRILRARRSLLTAGVLRAHHDLLLHPEVDPEDRRGHGLRALLGRWRAGLGQRRRRLGRACLQPAHAALRSARLVIGALVLTAVMVVFFGRSAPDLTQLAMLAAGTGFFCNAGDRRTLRDVRAVVPGRRSARAAPAS